MTRDRFWSKVNKDASGGCFEWTAYVRPDGYAIFGLPGRRSWGAHYAHRVAWEMTHGPIPTGMQVDHVCRNRACVNPAHLEVVTQRENGRRGLKGDLRTHCKHGHRYTDESTYLNKHGHRSCRTCHTQQRRERRHALRGLA